MLQLRSRATRTQTRALYSESLDALPQTTFTSVTLTGAVPLGIMGNSPRQPAFSPRLQAMQRDSSESLSCLLRAGLEE